MANVSVFITPGRSEGDGEGLGEDEEVHEEVYHDARPDPGCVAEDNHAEEPERHGPGDEGGHAGHDEYEQVSG